MSTYTYVGGRAAVTLKLPSGRFVTVDRGETIDVDQDQDVTALERHPEWEQSEPETPPTDDSDKEPLE